MTAATPLTRPVVLGLVSPAGAVTALAATETKGKTLEQLNS